MEIISRLAWRKSSYSGNGGGNCVEVADSVGVVLVRDTSDRAGVVLDIPVAAWRQFMMELDPVHR